jgi:hypothetical protein
MRTIALGLAVFGLAAAASAADIQKLQKAAKANKELRVQGYVNFKGSICESSGPLPEIELNIPPKGGTVCMRAGMVRLGNTWSGKDLHCLGTRISGVFVIYRSFGSFTGLDTMQYAVTVRGARSETRTFEAEITVEAGQATAAGAGPAPSESQEAGPMPICPALVS